MQNAANCKSLMQKSTSLQSLKTLGKYQHIQEIRNDTHCKSSSTTPTTNSI